MTYMFRTIGQVLGVALSAALLQATLDADLTAALGSDRALIDAIRRSTALIPHLEPPLRAVAVRAYAHGLARVWAMNAALAAFTLAVLAAMENEHLPETAEE